jgi:hypothetical protein
MDRATFAGMGDWLTSMEWEIEVFIIVLGTGVVHLAARLVVARLLGRLRRTRSVYDDALIESVGPPLAFAIWVSKNCSWLRVYPRERSAAARAAVRRGIAVAMARMPSGP